MVSDQLATQLVDYLIHLVDQNSPLFLLFSNISEGYGICRPVGIFCPNDVQAAATEGIPAVNCSPMSARKLDDPGLHTLYLHPELGLIFLGRLSAVDMLATL